MLQEGEKRSSNISHSLHPFNPLLLDYCSWYGFRLQPFAVKNSSSDVFHLDFGLLHSHWSLNVNRDILCRKSVKLNSVNEWNTPEFRFHCILMVLELNLVIHWSNTCFVDLFNTQRNVGSALDMLPILVQLGLCTCQKNGNIITLIIHTTVFNHAYTFQLQGSFPLCGLFPWGQSQHYRRQMEIMKMRGLVCKEKSNKSLLTELNCSLNDSILLLSRAQGWDREQRESFLSFTVGCLQKAKMQGSREQPHQWCLWESTMKTSL